MFVDPAKIAVMDFLMSIANRWYALDIEIKLGLSRGEYWDEIIEPLKKKFAEEVGQGNVAPLHNSSNIIPCALVLPEERMPLDKQFEAYRFKPPDFNKNVKLAFFSRGGGLNASAKPYVITNVSVRGPYPAPQYLGTVAQTIAGSYKEELLDLERVLAVFLSHTVNKKLRPWDIGGLKGDVVVGLSGRQDRDRVSVPVVNFDSSLGITVNSFTSDKTLAMSQYHRFIACEKILRI